MSALPSIGSAERLSTTRDACHTLAEHVLAPARYRVTGRIGLRATPGGFGTPVFCEAIGGESGEEQQVRVDGTAVAVTRGTTTATAPITTVADAAAFVGIAPGAPADLYPPATPLVPDAPLLVDGDTARVLAAWFELGGAVLEQLRSAGSDTDDPSLVQLWPEHFDISLEIGDKERRARATFGASPGDRAHPEPYLYVTRWPDVPDDPFWSEPSFPGASLGYREVAGEDDPRRAALAFFERARGVLHAP